MCLAQACGLELVLAHLSSTTVGVVLGPFSGGKGPQEEPEGWTALKQPAAVLKESDARLVGWPMMLEHEDGDGA
jgi:hypothetical protein